jgi:hypothetical protein
MATPTPQKLSSLSTSTLTAVLVRLLLQAPRPAETPAQELTRSRQLSTAPAPSLIPKINKNMSSLRAGIARLEQDEQQDEPIMLELKKQYGRLTDLCSGLGVDVQPLEVRPTHPELLIDDDSGM